MNKPSIMFLCTGNSCRSQMAEGWGHHLKGEQFVFYSAGIEAHGQNPLALKVMAEAGVDISEQQSTTVDDLPVSSFDYVISVCGHAEANCPYFPAEVKRIHHAFDDPPKLAANAKTEEEALEHYRAVRDQIRDFVADIEQHLK